MFQGWGGGSGVVQVLSAGSFLLGVLALLAALVLPPVAVLRSWLGRIDPAGVLAADPAAAGSATPLTAAGAALGVEDRDAELVAVRSALARASLRVAVLFPVLTLAGLGGQLRAQAPALAVAAALAWAACGAADLGTRRRASLTTPSARSDGATSGPAGNPWARRFPEVLAWVVAVLAAAVPFTLHFAASGFVAGDGSTGWAPQQERYTFALLAGVAVLLAATLSWGGRRLRHRPRAVLLSATTDAALRSVALRRLRAAVGAGQLVVVGCLLSVLPGAITGAAVPDASGAAAQAALRAGSSIALTATAVALAWLALACAGPWWTSAAAGTGSRAAGMLRRTGAGRPAAEH